MGNGNAPMVSVCMITYNHEAYIKQAIESVLMQRCSFPIELVIGEDCSTDNTLMICKEFAKNNPQIKLLPSIVNLGMMPNFVRTLSECRGKYIALCEGDDYWTDPYKLQKQVDFLEANEDFAICFHPVKIWQNGKLKADFLTGNVNDTTTIIDLANGNYIHTPSVVFRNKLFDQFPPGFSQSPVGDYFLHMLNARHGKIKKLPEIMGVYRLHMGNNWANLDKAKMYINLLKTLDLMQCSFENNIQQILLTQYANFSFEIAIRLAESKSNTEAGFYLQKSINSDYTIALNKIIALNKTIDYKIGNFILCPLRQIKHLLNSLHNIIREHT